MQKNSLYSLHQQNFQFTKYWLIISFTAIFKVDKYKFYSILNNSSGQDAKFESGPNSKYMECMKYMDSGQPFRVQSNSLAINKIQNKKKQMICPFGMSIKSKMCLMQKNSVECLHQQKFKFTKYWFIISFTAFIKVDKHKFFFK